MSSNTTPSPDATASSLWVEGFAPYLNASQAAAEGRPDAEGEAQKLVTLFESNAKTGDDESRALWAAAAALTQKALIERPGPLPLIDYSQEFEEHPGAGWQALCAWCYLGASVDVRTPPSLAIALHMTMAEFLYTETQQFPELYETIILPWFTSYWTRVFENARFRFQLPRMVDTELKAALELEPGARLQRVLGVMGFGLDVELPDEGKEWFKRDKAAAQASE